MLNPVIWLRIAAAITLIHAIMHTIGGVLSKPLPGTATMVANTMRDNRFDVFGAMRSYADFYFGLGVNIAIFLTVAAILFWQLSIAVQSSPVEIRPVLLLLALGFAALGLVCHRYFFWGPAVADLTITICLIIAFAGTRQLAVR